MNKQALSAFMDRLRTGLPTLKELIAGWPPDSADYQYPFCAVLIVSSYPRRFQAGPQLLKREGDTSTYLTAVVSHNIHLAHYYQDEEDLQLFYSDLDDLFNLPPNQGTLEIQYGDNSWDKADFKHMGNELESDEHSTHKGERRTTSILQGRTNQIISKVEKLPARWVLDPHISEQQRIVNNGQNIQP